MSASTTVKVSRTTLSELESIRAELEARSLDEAIKALIRRRRTEVLRGALGADKGRIRPFAEEDRGEER